MCRSAPRSLDQSRAELSLHAPNTYSPDGENATDMTVCSEPLSVDLCEPVRASHSLTVLSLLPVANIVPLRNKARVQTCTALAAQHTLGMKRDRRDFAAVCQKRLAHVRRRCA